MPGNLLILLLVAGYCFLHLFAYTKYRAQRLDGHRLIFESALLAIPLSGIGRLAAYCLAKLDWVRAVWANIAPPFDFFGTALLAVLAGVCIPLALNWIADAADGWDGFRSILARFWVFSNRRALSTAMRRHGSELHRLLYTALDEERLVAITLDNKKVYIGYVYGAPKLEPHDVYVALIPLFSGYRDAVSLELKLTQDYLAAYEGDPNSQEEGEFVVALPLNQIRIASFFDPDSYAKFEIKETGEPAGK